MCAYCWGDIKNHDLINDIKITAELNERCEYILIGPKKLKNVKNVAWIKKTLKTFITSILGATNVVITSEWSNIVYNTPMTDISGLQNGSFSHMYVFKT